MFQATTLLSSALLFSSLSWAAPVEEPVLGHMTSYLGIHLQVKSGGCTSKQDFTAKKEVRKGKEVLVFYRNQEDPCRAYLPYGAILNFSYEELGLDRADTLSIGNVEAGVTGFPGSY